MAIEYIAWIAEDDYDAFKKLLAPIMPDEYDMWLRVRDIGKRRAFADRAAMVEEIEVSPMEFRAYCASLTRPEFNIYGLDRCAREKAYAARTAKPPVHA
jgi:hypothetical protein